HDGRIQTDLPCQQRQDASDAFRHDDHRDHSDPERHPSITFQSYMMQIRMPLTTARRAPTMSATRISLKITLKISLNSISPTASPRIIRVELWEPQLPPVPMSIGMKVISTGITAIAFSYYPRISPVTVAESIM